MLQSCCGSNVVARLISSENIEDVWLLIVFAIRVHAWICYQHTGDECSCFGWIIRVCRSNIIRNRERILQKRTCSPNQIFGIVELEADITSRGSVHFSLIISIGRIWVVIQSSINWESSNSRLRVATIQFEIIRGDIAVTGVSVHLQIVHIIIICVVSIFAIQIGEGKRQWHIRIVIRDIEDKLTTTYREIVRSKRLCQLQIALVIVTDDIHLVDIRVQGLQHQRNLDNSLFAIWKIGNLEHHSVVVKILYRIGTHIRSAVNSNGFYRCGLVRSIHLQGVRTCTEWW